MTFSTMRGNWPRGAAKINGHRKCGGRFRPRIMPVSLAEEIFEQWQKIKGEDVARHHLLSMFGAKSE